jgi:hypothetical protein
VPRIRQQADDDTGDPAKSAVSDQLSSQLDRRCIAMVQTGGRLHTPLARTASQISRASAALRPAGFSEAECLNRNSQSVVCGRVGNSYQAGPQWRVKIVLPQPGVRACT